MLFPHRHNNLPPNSIQRPHIAESLPIPIHFLPLNNEPPSPSFPQILLTIFIPLLCFCFPSQPPQPPVPQNFRHTQQLIPHTLPSLQILLLSLHWVIIYLILPWNSYKSINNKYLFLLQKLTFLNDFITSHQDFFRDKFS